MGALVAIGSTLPDAVFYLKYNSVNDFSIYFWDDAQGTVASNLSGAVATIETGSLDAPTTFATGVRVGTTNQMQFTVPAASTTAIADATAFRVVLTITGSRFIIASGKVRIQK
jgi:hypothetical protein